MIAVAGFRNKIANCCPKAFRVASHESYLQLTESVADLNCAFSVSLAVR